MRKRSTALADHFLQSLQGMKEVEMDPFFYTRVLSRMQHPVRPAAVFKPTWVIVTLAFFVALNIWMISRGSDVINGRTEVNSSAQAFAETYNLNSASNY